MNGCMLNQFSDNNGVTIKSYDWSEVGETGEINGVTYIIVSEDVLRQKIDNGDDISIVCTSEVDKMNYLFVNKNNRSSWSGYEINGDISGWDVNNVTDAICFRTQFNGNISNWDVSNVTDMSGMFNNSEFNNDISNWDVSNVTDMSIMFPGSPFNNDISNWDVSNVTDEKYV